MLKHNGITYIDKDEVNSMSKSEEGKVKLERIGFYQDINWVKLNPVGKPNREKRRRPVDPLFGYMKNNHLDRTKHKRF